MFWKIVIGVVVLLVLGVGTTLFVADRLFDLSVRRTVERLARAQAEAPAPAASPGPGADALPEPVRRYLRFAVPKGRAPIADARVEHGGTFRLGPEQPWLPMEAVEHFFTRPPAFIWNARVRMAPGIAVAVRDSYVDGHGGVDARLMALVPVARAAGPEVDTSALLRWLAEAVWFPTALRAGPGLRWEAVDGTHARAVVTDGPLRATAVFTFAKDGRITAMESADRYRTVGTAQVRTPWLGRYADYREFGGVMAPTRAEVAWKLERGEFVYARVEITRIAYDVQ